MGWFKGLLARVFGPKAPQSTLGSTVPENGVDFNYPVIFVPGPPNMNASRNREVNDAALPFTPEEYKKIITEACAKNLNQFSVPREIVFMDELPHTPLEKVDFMKLEKM